MTLALTHIGLTCFFVPINIFICSKVLEVQYKSVLKQLKTGVIIGVICILGGFFYNAIFAEKLIHNYLSNALCLAFSLFILSIISLFIIEASGKQILIYCQVKARFSKVGNLTS